MLKLRDIRSKLEELCDRVPAIPEGNFLLPNNDNGDKNGGDNGHKGGGESAATAAAIDETATREWAARLQVVLEEFNLYVCCVGTATYKWGTERSGAGDQNLTLLLAEVSASQEQISTAVTPRLTNLLAPVVDLVIEKTVTHTTRNPASTSTTTTTIPNNGNAGSDNPPTTTTTTTTVTEIKENHFTRKLVDPAFLTLCHKILARNAPLLRHVVLSNFHKLLAAMKDFLKAQENDAQHSRSFAY